jgi:hypothetical protein
MVSYLEELYAFWRGFNRYSTSGLDCSAKESECNQSSSYSRFIQLGLDLCAKCRVSLLIETASLKTVLGFRQQTAVFPFIEDRLYAVCMNGQFTSCSRCRSLKKFEQSVEQVQIEYHSMIMNLQFSWQFYFLAAIPWCTLKLQVPDLNL